jgi:hypothetical protein
MRIRQCGLVARMAACLVAGLAYSAGAGAIEFGNELEVHGYGSQDYLQASHNTYLGADNRGTWDDNFLGLVGTVTLNDKSKLWAQLEASSAEATRFTWFFVDYQLTDALRFHAGRVKYPLGLYNEYIDTKFLQVSSLEPALYQGAADFVHDAYTGVGADYTQSLNTAGEIVWQVYGGNTYDTDPPPDTRDRRAYGGRITYRTPIDGLRFMLSGYRSHVEILATRPLTNEDRLIGSIDFVRADWDIKSEYGTHKFLGVSSNAWYFQVGRTVAQKWMPFFRYDHVDLDKESQSTDSATQKILVFGVNYKLLSNVSIRFEDHFNRGYALPVASGEVPAGQGDRTWNLFVAGVHFMF